MKVVKRLSAQPGIMIIRCPVKNKKTGHKCNGYMYVSNTLKQVAKTRVWQENRGIGCRFSCNHNADKKIVITP